MDDERSLADPCFVPNADFCVSCSYPRTVFKSCFHLIYVNLVIVLCHSSLLVTFPCLSETIILVCYQCFFLCKILTPIFCAFFNQFQ